MKVKGMTNDTTWAPHYLPLHYMKLLELPMLPTAPRSFESSFDFGKTMSIPDTAPPGLVPNDGPFFKAPIYIP
jgi:hypothetical protein